MGVEGLRPKSAILPRVRTKQERLGVLVAAVAIGVLLLGTEVTICPVAGIVGVPCPSCGLTRATLALLSGDFSRAHEIHPGVLPVLTYLALAALAGTGGRGKVSVARGFGIVGLALLAGLIGLWVARFGGLLGGPVKVHPWIG